MTTGRRERRLYAQGRRSGFLIGLLLGIAVALIAVGTVRGGQSNPANPANRTAGKTEVGATPNELLRVIGPHSAISGAGGAPSVCPALSPPLGQSRPTLGECPDDITGPILDGPWPTIPVVVLPTANPRLGTAKLAGEASWYCLAGRSRCTRGYPDGLYAAIRRDLLGHRGDRARVCAGERCVTVTIVDCLCAGGPGIIDLYADAYVRLAPLSTGRLAVTISW